MPAGAHLMQFTSSCDWIGLDTFDRIQETATREDTSQALFESWNDIGLDVALSFYKQGGVGKAGRNQ